MPLPERFGRYLLVERIATGGMAEIFKAKLIGVMGFEKTVVIKRILPFWSERRDFVTMLVDEAKILVHLNHPNIVQVFELGCEENTYYIAMEYVEGVDLRQLMKRCWSLGTPIPQDLALFIIKEALEGLQYAHQRSLKEQGPLQIVHRDISPQNILLSFDGEVKVTDFGIAKALIKTHETQTGVLKGKFAYMSPEQATGAVLDARSDLFSTAVVLYELLFGGRLFAAGSDIETLDRVRRAQVPWPKEKMASLSPGVLEVLSRALALAPGERYATAEEFRQALAQARSEGSECGPGALVDFVRELYAQEIQDRRRKDEQVLQATESFLRQTRVSPSAEGNTVSLVEKEASQSSLARATHTVSRWVRPAWRVWKGWAWALGILAIAALAYLGFRSPQAPDADDAVAPPPAVAALAPVVPQLPTPIPSPTALPSPEPLLLGSLSLKAFPAQAKLFAQYGDVKREGRGELVLKDIPAGIQVKARAELKDYDSQARSFEISPTQLQGEHVFQLKKRVPAYGSLTVNALPWGRASVTGLFSSEETPITRSRVAEGSYRVTVSDYNRKKILTANAQVKGGRQTKCTARFEGRGSMSCQ